MIRKTSNSYFELLSNPRNRDVLIKRLYVFSTGGFSEGNTVLSFLSVMMMVQGALIL